MEVVDFEKKAAEDTMDEPEIYDTDEETAEVDVNGELTKEAVDKFQHNHWQFSDEGKGTRAFFSKLCICT